MKLKITNINEINSYAARQAEKAIDIAAEQLFQLGLQTINEARDNARFFNWTNNLRSSFGVAVSVNGKIVKSDFKQVGDGALGDGGEGLAKAQKLIDSEVYASPNQLLLILVAGEHYALYVEAKHNKTVLTTFARDLIKKLKQK